MTKSFEEVLKERYPDWNPLIIPLVQDDGSGSYFRRDLWPSSYGTAPTDAQLTEWMNE